MTGRPLRHDLAAPGCGPLTLMVVSLLRAVALAASCGAPRDSSSNSPGLQAGVHFEMIQAQPGSTLVTVRITNGSSGRITIKRARSPQIQNNWIVVALNERTLEQLPV